MAGFVNASEQGQLWDMASKQKSEGKNIFFLFLGWGVGEGAIHPTTFYGNAYQSVILDEIVIMLVR